jgi:hypothetical protein
MVVVVVFALTREKVQTKLAYRAAGWLSEKLDTKVAVQNVKIDFLKRAHLEGLYIEDQKGDTLAYIGDFSVSSSQIVNDLWNKKTSIIKDVRLKEGVVNLKRPKNNEEWNFAFIEKAFATESEDSTKAEAPQIDLKNLQLSNVRFQMDDQWLGQTIQSDLGEFALKMNGFDLEKSFVNIKSIDVANTYFSFKEFKGGKPTNPNRRVNKSSWGTAFNADDFSLILAAVNLKNINFEYQRNNHQSVAGRFDERHIVAKDLQLNLEELFIKGDTITADIVNLSAKERSGLHLKKLRAHVTLNQQLAEFQDLYLETNRSVVQNYYSMRYVNFHDFNEYIENVTMYAKFKNSYIDKRDIAFFAGPISQIPTTVRLDGKAEGTVTDFYLSNIHAVGPNINFKGSGRITGLPDIDATFFDLKAERLLTTGKEIVRIAPEANTDAIQWNGLQTIDFSGKFQGTTKKFNADGLIKTNHGLADLDLFLDLEKKIPSYTGKVDAKRLDLGKILGRSDIGVVTAKGTIKGQGFDFNNVNATVDAKVGEFTYDGVRYQNIEVNGSVANKQFVGLAKSRDEKLGFDFEGNVNLSGENPSYDFKSDIIKVNLKTLGVTRQDMILKAKVNLDFTGKNIDEFVGKAILQDVKLSYGKERIEIPRVRLNSFYVDSIGKVLDLKSTVADARIKGRYSLRGIKKATLAFLHHYLPTYIKKTKAPDNEDFDFDILVRNANKIIQIFEPKLLVDSGTAIRGSINTSRQQLNLVGLVPGVTYDGVRLKNVGISSQGDYSVFNSEIVAKELMVNKSAILKDANLQLAVSSDTVGFNLKTNPVDEFLGEANLKGRATAFSDRFEVNISPSTFIVKDDKYRLYSMGPIQYTKSGILLAKDVLIQNGTQQIIFNSDYDGLTNNATIITENIDLEKISSYANSKDLALQGRVNATFSAKDIWGNTMVTGTATTVNDFRINGDTLGTADLQFSYDKVLNTLAINESSKIENGNAHIYTQGKIDFNNENIDLSADLKETPISFANQYVAEIIDSLRGEATGKIRVQGKLTNPIILGDLSVKKTALTVIFTGCSYRMDDINLKLSKNSIDFNPITIYDERTNPGTARLTGRITHSNYDKYRLRLNAKSNDFLGLNTDQFNGELFYGYIPSKLDMSITGAIDDITMDIKAEPLANSEFYLPLADDGSVGTYDFIKFKTLGTFQDQKIKKNKGSSYFKVNMDIKATPDVLATIILDQNTQEKIEARGSGNISLNVDLGNSINMYNTFTVKEGVYKFNFRGLLSKEFTLDEGGTITWNGDAYKANLDMRAIYNVKTSLYPLVSGQEQLTTEEINQAKKVEDTHVAIDLTGPLSNPDIQFDITQPNNRSIGGTAQAKLEQIRSNQNDVIYQAGMLLLFGSFKPAAGGVNTGELATNTSISTASDLVGQVLSQQLTNTIGKLGIPNLTFDIGYKRYSADVTQGTGFGSRDQVNLGFQASFFKERFIVDFGNTLDFANAAAQAGGAQSFTYNGDFRGQYLITLDGRYRLNAFRVSTFDYVDSRPVARGGVGLIYKKKFNRWKDLFKRKSKTTVILPFDIEEKDRPDIKTDSVTFTSFLLQKEPSGMTTLDIISKLSF